MCFLWLWINWTPRRVTISSAYDIRKTLYPLSSLPSKNTLEKTKKDQKSKRKGIVDTSVHTYLALIQFPLLLLFLRPNPKTTDKVRLNFTSICQKNKPVNFVIILLNTIVFGGVMISFVLFTLQEYESLPCSTVIIVIRIMGLSMAHFLS